MAMLMLMSEYSFLLFLLSTSLPLTLQQLYAVCLNNRGNFTANSTFSSNLDRLSSTLSSAAPSPGGFYNFSVGTQTPVNSISLCVGDVSAVPCRDCINNAIAFLRRRCPNQKEAIVYYDSCMVRYSNRSIYGSHEDRPAYYLANDNNVTSTSVQDFNQVVNNLLDGIGTRAAAGGPTRKFATGDTVVGNVLRIYALVQCTPDLSELQCSSCLTAQFEQYCCFGRIGLRILGPSCSFRYEMYPFYQSSADAPPPQPATARPAPPPLNWSTGGRGKRGSSSRTALVTVLAIVAFIAISVFGCTLLLRRWKPKKKETVPEEMDSKEAFQFKFNIIREATDDFSEENKLGQGGFGVVYKGKLQNGQDVAVKRLSKNSNQGRKEFENEVQFMVKLQHRNLVKLLGFSIQGVERLLVYEFLPLSSLEKYISDPTKSLLLDWDKRYKIITGIAGGTLYLHEDSQVRIIHRDLKPSNILLDADMNPKISDFGMAKLFPTDITQAHASRVIGTLGYMAPEYVQNGQVSVKTDVYSFGVLVLEIISGQRINHFSGEGEEFSSLLSYAWENWKKGTVHNFLDPNLRGSTPESEVMRCLHLALLCVQENAANRPSMETVVLMLNSSISVPVPSRPAFLLHSLVPPERPSSGKYGAQVTELVQSENQSIQFSNNEVSLSEIEPR